MGRRAFPRRSEHRGPQEQAARRNPRVAGRAQPRLADGPARRRWPKPTPGSAAILHADAPIPTALRDGPRGRPAQRALRLAGREVQLRVVARGNAPLRRRAVASGILPPPSKSSYRPEMRRMERAVGAATARHGLERPPAGDGPSPQQRRPARLRPDRSEGRVQARRDADFRADVGPRSASG